MARDNAPKERQRKQLERKLERCASYDRILIVCEGSKTEPNYFREIRAAHRLHTANVEVQPSELGTSPLQVVQYAKELFENGDRHKKIRHTTCKLLETATRRAQALAARFNAYTDPEPYTGIADLAALLTALRR